MWHLSPGVNSAGSRARPCTSVHLCAPVCACVRGRAAGTNKGDACDRTGNPIWVEKAVVILDDVRPIHSVELYS